MPVGERCCRPGTRPATRSCGARRRARARRPTGRRRPPGRRARRTPTRPPSAAACRPRRSTRRRRPRRRARPGAPPAPRDPSAGPPDGASPRPRPRATTGPAATARVGGKSSGRRPPKTKELPSRSASVTWPVASAKRANSALETAQTSIQNGVERDPPDRPLAVGRVGVAVLAAHVGTRRRPGGPCRRSARARWRPVGCSAPPRAGGRARSTRARRARPWARQPIATARGSRVTPAHPQRVISARQQDERAVSPCAGRRPGGKVRVRGDRPTRARTRTRARPRGAGRPTRRAARAGGSADRAPEAPLALRHPRRGRRRPVAGGAGGRLRQPRRAQHAGLRRRQLGDARGPGDPPGRVRLPRRPDLGQPRRRGEDPGDAADGPRPSGRTGLLDAPDLRRAGGRQPCSPPTRPRRLWKAANARGAHASCGTSSTGTARRSRSRTASWCSTCGRSPSTSPSESA